MTTAAGSVYRVGSRRYIDSQGLYNIANTHAIVAIAEGWRVHVEGGAVRCLAVAGRPRLPGQRGELYALHRDGEFSLRDQRRSWVADGHLQHAGTFESWPEPPPLRSCCGAACACGPCRDKHGGEA